MRPRGFRLSWEARALPAQPVHSQFECNWKTASFHEFSIPMMGLPSAVVIITIIIIMIILGITSIMVIIIIPSSIPIAISITIIGKAMPSGYALFLSGIPYPKGRQVGPEVPLV